VSAAARLSSSADSDLPQRPAAQAHGTVHHARMMYRMKTSLLAAALTLGLGAAGWGWAATAAMNKDAYKAEQQRIEAQQKSERKACDRLKGNAQDLCQAQAKAHAKTAQAQLEARYKPGPEAERQAKETQAEAEYDVARVRCSALKAKAKDGCVVQAKARLVAAKRQAMVEKVDAIAALKARRERQRKGTAKPETQQDRYAAQKARCNMLGEERDECLADVQRKFQKS
jgi:hypothetical protein